jgi:transcriptional regulator with PAS, ATPase and Fis domain
MKDEDKPREQLLEELKTLRDCCVELEKLKAKYQRSQEIIYQSEQDWKDIFDTITDMITIHDKDFNIIRANKAAEKILGLPFLSSPTEAKCYKYYHGKDSPPEGCPSCRCLSTGVPAAFEVFEPHLNMFIEVRAIPRFNSNGELIGLIHIVRDITKRKKAEEELEKYRYHLEELVEERTAKLKEALENVKTLKGLLPICAWCKKIRNDKGYWDQIEDYIRKHSDADFTHGICPECMEKIKDE